MVLSCSYLSVDFPCAFIFVRPSDVRFVRFAIFFFGRSRSSLARISLFAVSIANIVHFTGRCSLRVAPFCWFGYTNGALVPARCASRWWQAIFNGFMQLSERTNCHTTRVCVCVTHALARCIRSLFIATFFNIFLRQLLSTLFFVGSFHIFAPSDEAQFCKCNKILLASDLYSL